MMRLSVENRSFLWLVGGFLFCPCHLPLTLGLLGVALAGTALGVVIRDHIVLAALMITTVWVLATWRGLWLLRTKPSCELPSTRDVQ